MTDEGVDGEDFWDAFMAVFQSAISVILRVFARFTQNSEVGKWERGKLECRSGNGLGIRRWGQFVHSCCRRGAHGVTRPTALGTRDVFSISLPTSEFGLTTKPTKIERGNGKWKREQDRTTLAGRIHVRIRFWKAMAGSLETGNDDLPG